jgi:hypothetical protein
MQVIRLPVAWWTIGSSDVRDCAEEAVEMHPEHAAVRRSDVERAA